MLHLQPSAGSPQVALPGPRVEVGLSPDGSVVAGPVLPQGARPWLSLALTAQGYAVRAQLPTTMNGQSVQTSYVPVGTTLRSGAAQLTILPASPLPPEQQFTPPPSKPSGLGLLTPASALPGGEEPAAQGLIPDAQLGRSIAELRAGANFGPYRLETLLGQGGHGRVYRAWDTRLERFVAIKILLRRTEHARKRFLREARTLAALNHPAIVDVHDLGEIGGFAYVVTEFVEGKALDAYRPGQVSPYEAAAIMRDVALAAHHAHGHQVVHRDIKPANVLLDKNGNVFLVDFGIAGLQDTETNPGLTSTGVPIGTPAFMAPEQVGGHSDRRIDVYGVGATLLWWLTGIAPGTSPNWAELPPVQGLPRELRTVLTRSLQRDPEARYADAEALAAALATVRPSSGLKPAALLAVVGLLSAAIGAWAAGWIGEETVVANPTPTAGERASPAELLADLERRARDSDWPTLQVELEQLRAQVQDEPLLAERLEAVIAELRWRDACDEARRLELEGGSTKQLLEAYALAQRMLPKAEETGPEALLEVLVRRGAASEALELAAKLEARPRTQWAEVRAHRQLGDTERCLEACARLATQPDPWPAVARGERAAALGAHDLALSAARSALEVDPELVPARLLLAQALIDTGDTAAARELAEELADGRDPRPDVLLAQALRGDPDFETRQACLERAATRYPQPPLELHLLRVELELERGGDALTPAEALHASRDARALLFHGLAVSKDDPLRAGQLYGQAYSQDAFLVEETLDRCPWLPAAEVREAAGVRAFPRPAYSAEEPVASPGVAPEAQPAIDRAVEAATSGQPWSSIAPHLEAAREAAAGNLGVARCVALLEVGRGRYPESLSSLERAVALGADRAWASYLRAQVLIRHVSPAESVKELRANERLAEGNWATLWQAELTWQTARSLDDFVAARNGFQRVLQLDPTNRHALLGRAICSIQMGDLDDARPLLDDLLRRQGVLDARVLMMRAILEGKLLLPDSSVDECLQRLYRFEHLRPLTGGSSPRITGSQPALRFRAFLPWAWRMLNEARAREPKRARTYVILGAAALRDPEPDRERVLGFWRQAKSLNPTLILPGALKTQFTQAFAEPPDLSSD